jgi:membrane-bound metal-dependent hydrolase YbcI (DUF457 family)
MPLTATHIFFPLIVLSIIRDYFIKYSNKRKFPLHYVLIGGVAGILPDLDVAAFWILTFFGFSYGEVHRTFLHSLFIPVIFLLLGMVFFALRKNISEFGRHKLKISIIFFVIAFGNLFHLLLDWLFQSKIMPFYPISSYASGLDLFGYLPLKLGEIVTPCLDGLLIIIWLIYIEWKHKISDFI